MSNENNPTMIDQSEPNLNSDSLKNENSTSFSVTNQISSSTEPRFEQAVSELEQIVQRLNQPNINLDEAVDLYERGVRLAQRGRNLIGDAESRVNQLRELLTQPEGGGGNAPRS